MASALAQTIQQSYLDALENYPPRPSCMSAVSYTPNSDQEKLSLWQGFVLKYKLVIEVKKVTKSAKKSCLFIVRTKVKYSPEIFSRYFPRWIFFFSINQY